ncbi:NAD-P-binding protein [Atractiella rhizophila]|nr:NAD-P-binding protein [Atractiella rhizophila]
MSSAIELQTAFLSQPSFAVVGASKDPSKFGNKVLKWYKAHNLSVTPINPKESEIEGISAIQSIDSLQNPKSTSLSVITPPKVTMTVLPKALELGIPYIWLQPGCEDAEVVEWIKENAKDKVLYGGVCVLVDGEKRMREGATRL